MRITEALKAWLIENCGVAKDASDDELRKAAGQALAEEALSTEQYARMTTPKDGDDANQFTKRLDQVVESLGKLTEALAAGPANGKKAGEEEAKKAAEEKAIKDAKEAAEKAKGQANKAQPSNLAKMVANMGIAADVDDRGDNVRVKEAVERYSHTKTALICPDRTKRGTPHPYAGQPAKVYGRGMETGSDRDMALAGAWAKFQLMSVTPRFAGSTHVAWDRMSEHEKSLLAHLADREDWDNSDDERPRIMRGYPGGIKQLIDDGGASGALEAAPIVFDDRVIEVPLLYGELYPLVETMPLARGRRVEGVSLGTVTGSWGGVDDTAVGLFTTTGYVAAFDTTIYRWEGAIRIGLDFISDTPLNFGQIITRQYGERLLEDLDDVIASGNGTTQPSGIINHATITTVAWAATTSVTNYEALRFGVAKPEHRGLVNTAVFCGTEESYSRAMGLAVGATDTRRVFVAPATTNYDSYSIMGRAYKINESLSNEEIFYAIMARYRMYMRRGITVRTTTEGDTLTRANEMLIIAMARYGGQLQRAGCGAITTTAPA